MNALLTIFNGRFDRNPNVHGSPPCKELTLAWVAKTTRTPMFCPDVPRFRRLSLGFRHG
jgi:hypothetical protein